MKGTLKMLQLKKKKKENAFYKMKKNREQQISPQHINIGFNFDLN